MQRLRATPPRLIQLRVEALAEQLPQAIQLATTRLAALAEQLPQAIQLATTHRVGLRALRQLRLIQRLRSGRLTQLQLVSLLTSIQTRAKALVILRPPRSQQRLLLRTVQAGAPLPRIQLRLVRLMARASLRLQRLIQILVKRLLLLIQPRLIQILVKRLLLPTPPRLIQTRVEAQVRQRLLRI